MMEKAPIVVHYGGMVSEKSLALIQEYRKARSVDEVCLCYVPEKRRRNSHIVSRFMAGEGDENLAEIKIPAKGMRSSEELYNDVVQHIKRRYDLALQNGIAVARLRINVIGDEIQHFDSGIKGVVEELSSYGVRCILALLDLDYRGDPFPLQGRPRVTATDIIGIATETHRHYARCAYIMEDGAKCGKNATRSQRYRDNKRTEPSHYNDPTIVIAKGRYIPVCEEHHTVPGKHRRIVK